MTLDANIVIGYLAGDAKIIDTLSLAGQKMSGI
jgi:hypothetical protein